MLKSWHRSVGIFAAVFLLLLTVTGLLLMQTDDLNLDSRYVSNDRLLDWYGIRPAPPPLSFSAANHWLTQLGSRIYFDTQSLSGLDGRLIGAVPKGDEILVATTKMLVLLTTQGMIAEKLGAESNVPSDLIHAGSSVDGSITLQSETHGRFVFDPDSGNLRSIQSTRPVQWSTVEPAPGSILDVINGSYRGEGLSLERIVLDLHTGRLFGALGVALINLASIALMILVASGSVLWWIRSRENNTDE